MVISILIHFSFQPKKKKSGPTPHKPPPSTPTPYTPSAPPFTPYSPSMPPHSPSSGASPALKSKLSLFAAKEVISFILIRHKKKMFFSL